VPEPWYYQELACPDCGEDLSLERETILCPCGFSVVNRPPLNLRLQRPRVRTLEALAGRSQTGFADVNLDRPATTYSGPHALRDSSELFSAAETWLSPGRRLLDLGCGPRDQSVPAAHLGLDYVGVDFASSAADLHADGHAIPFRPAAFDAVLAYAVLEHLYNPVLALREVARVLRPDGVFFGAVSQGEPFHDSYFHFTAWGVMSSFHEAGLRVLRLWPSYDTLHALATMGRYARLVKAMVEIVYRVDRAMPFLAPRKFFRGSREEKQLEELHRAGSLCFVAVKAGTAGSV
jgi:SAM-dependent methyltransferase